MTARPVQHGSAAFPDELELTRCPCPLRFVPQHLMIVQAKGGTFHTKHKKNRFHNTAPRATSRDNRFMGFGATPFWHRRAPICLIGTDEARIPHHSKNTSDAPSFRHARYPECFHISLDVLGSTKVPSLYNSRDALGGVDLSRDCAGQPRFFYPSCHRMTCHHHAM